MHIHRTLILSLAGALSLCWAAADAQAQTRRLRGEAPPITITKRSFLDSGKVVPVDSMRNYVTMDTRFGLPVYDNNRSWFGRETLPRRFDIPGAGPLFNF
ncbi:MAG: uncharacterized protein JWN93_2775 [Hyphomicrobiales bacterium]|nr:uncharacterized protein [Hyphomicrobiales bacterium]